MHETVLSFVERAVSAREIRNRHVLEVGSYDVNGSVRPLIERHGPSVYIGLDLREGPGVDHALDASKIVEFYGEASFDVILCCEVLEHAEDWRSVISNLKRALRLGGLLVITTRSRGFPLHEYPDDHWRFEIEDMQRIFADMPAWIEPDPQAPGVFVVARRLDPESANLEQITVRSMKRNASSKLITLCMIVKNEAETIETTLLSAVKVGIDQAVIFDTGSTDHTVKVVTELLNKANVPLKLLVGSFIDFASTRNLALGACKEETEWILCLDADDVIEADSFRDQLAKVDPQVDGLRVQISVPNAVFESTRIVRASAGWQYVGAVHEALIGPSAPQRLPGVVIHHFPPPQNQEATRTRWEKDVDILNREISKNPTNTRAWFYLGLTYAWLGLYEIAISVLQRRITLCGWVEELYYAELMIARCMQGTKAPQEHVHLQYLNAFKLAPHRAEALYELALTYKDTDNPLCFLYAFAAYRKEYPTQDVLFVDSEVYAWKAADLVGTMGFYVEEFAVGEEAARKALAAHPQDERLARNLKFYTDRHSVDGL